MGDNGFERINLKEKINKIITDLLFKENIDDSIIELGELLKIILSSNLVDIYQESDLYLLCILIEKLNISSPVLDILLNTIKYNGLSAKLFSPYDKNLKEDQNQKEGLLECLTPERFQMIEINPYDKTKTFLTIEKDPISKEETVVERRVVKEPDATSLEDVFIGALQSEVNKALLEQDLEK